MEERSDARAGRVQSASDSHCGDVVLIGRPRELLRRPRRKQRLRRTGIRARARLVHSHGRRLGSGLRAARQRRRVIARAAGEERLRGRIAGRGRRRESHGVAQGQRRDLALRRRAERGAQRAHVLRPVVRRHGEAVAEGCHELRGPRAGDRVERGRDRIGEAARNIAPAPQGIGRRLAGGEAEERRTEGIDVGPRPELAARLEILLGAIGVARRHGRRAAARGGAERAPHEMRAPQRRRAVAADRDRGRADVEMEQAGLVDRVGAGEEGRQDLLRLLRRQRLARAEQAVERAPVGRLDDEVHRGVGREAVEQRQHVGVAERVEIQRQRLDLGDAGGEQRAEIRIERLHGKRARRVCLGVRAGRGRQPPARDAGRQEFQQRHAPRARRVLRAIDRPIRPAAGDRLLDPVAPDHRAGRKEVVGWHAKARDCVGRLYYPLALGRGAGVRGRTFTSATIRVRVRGSVSLARRLLRRGLSPLRSSPHPGRGGNHGAPPDISRAR